MYHLAYASLSLETHSCCHGQSLSWVTANICLHCVYKKTELIAQGLMAVGHADLSHICALNVVALRSIL